MGGVRCTSEEEKERRRKPVYHSNGDKRCKIQYTYCEVAFNWFLYAQLSSIAKGVAYP